MTIKINPDLNLNDDSLRGFTSEQVIFIFAGMAACAAVCVLLSLLKVPAAFWGIAVTPVVFPIVGQGFKQKNGMTMMEILAKKRRIRSGKPLYYYSTEAVIWEQQKVRKEEKRWIRKVFGLRKEKSWEGGMSGYETQESETAETV